MSGIFLQLAQEFLCIRKFSEEKLQKTRIRWIKMYAFCIHFVAIIIMEDLV